MPSESSEALQFLPSRLSRSRCHLSLKSRSRCQQSRLSCSRSQVSRQSCSRGQPGHLSRSRSHLSRSRCQPSPVSWCKSSQGKSVNASQINPKMPSSSMPSLLYFSTVKEQKRVRDARKGQTTINSVDDIRRLACGRSQPVKVAVDPYPNRPLSTFQSYWSCGRLKSDDWCSGLMQKVQRSYRRAWYKFNVISLGEPFRVVLTTRWRMYE